MSVADAAKPTASPQARSAATPAAKSKPSVVLIVPTWNEADAIAVALAEVPRSAVGRIIVADGGSRDETAARARAAGADVIDAGAGYGRACLAGAIEAGAGCEILVFMDGDGSDRAVCIPQLIAPIAAGTHDFVIASRVRGTREPGSMGAHQIFIGLLIGALIKLLYGTRYTDMCAFRAIRRDRLLALGMREMTYGWNLEMQMRVAKQGLRILELPVPYGRRAAGSSKVSGNLRGAVRASLRLLSAFFRVLSERSPATSTTP